MNNFMKVKQLFKPTGVLESTDGRSVLLDKDNCKIINITKNEDSVIIHLERESDKEKGVAYLKVRDEFKSLSSQLLRWAFTGNVVNLTLNEVENLETNLEIESSGERLRIIS